MHDDKNKICDTFDDAMEYVYSTHPVLLKTGMSGELKGALRDTAPYAADMSKFVDIADNAGITDILRPSGSRSECINMYNECIKSILCTPQADKITALDILTGYRFLCGHDGAEIMKQLIDSERAAAVPKTAQRQTVSPHPTPTHSVKPQHIQLQTEQTQPQPTDTAKDDSETNRDSLAGCLALLTAAALFAAFPAVRWIALILAVLFVLYAVLRKKK